MQQYRPNRTNAMPRLTRGLWSALSQVIDEEDQAERERSARRRVANLELAPAYARLEDFAATDEAAFAASLCAPAEPAELAPVLHLDDYR